MTNVYNKDPSRPKTFAWISNFASHLFNTTEATLEEGCWTLEHISMASINSYTDLESISKYGLASIIMVIA